MVGKLGSTPALIHDVVVWQTPPLGPPLHWMPVVEERQNSPTGTPLLSVGVGRSGKPERWMGPVSPPPLLPPAGEVGFEKSGFVPVGLKVHHKPSQSFPQTSLHKGLGLPALNTTGGPKCGPGPSLLPLPLPLPEPGNSHESPKPRASRPLFGMAFGLHEGSIPSGRSMAL
jgi:hypothetical protein